MRTAQHTQPTPAAPRGRSLTRAARAVALSAVLVLAPAVTAVATASTVPVDLPRAVAAPSGPCADDTGVTVVVDATDLGGQVQIGCATGAATGTEALLAAGFTETRDPGGFICAISSLPDPCPATFEGSYWAYWSAEPGGEWVMAAEGSDTTAPAPGSVEGWRYNDGSAPPSIAPPVPGAAAQDDQEATDEAAEAPADEPSEEATEEAAEDDGAVAAPSDAEPTDPGGVSPVVVAGLALLVVLALAAVLVSRRRSSLHGPAGQD